ncbi:hypothetical protein UA32_12040 [Photobacterium angustum]|uniref:Uncharacterized protein n=1 Tax=Photobacterium angustum TaxID=661 RepID=A0ABX5GYP0_PHOAN|nr:hypothetical protein [Photobacterium angustum]KJG37687.1 hypothetical protein UA32_12040 [Photobacterium angustum]PSX03981.1 hypothetical protein C0W27_21035 [Photobacterium angustum]
MDIAIHGKIITSSLLEIFQKLGMSDFNGSVVSKDNSEPDDLGDSGDEIFKYVKVCQNNPEIGTTVIGCMAEVIGLIACYQKDINSYLSLEQKKFTIISSFDNNQEIRNFYMTDDFIALKNAQFELINNDKAKLKNKDNHVLEIFKAGYKNGYRQRLVDLFIDMNSFDFNEEENRALKDLFILINDSLIEMHKSVIYVKGVTFRLINSKMKPIVFNA